MSKHKCVNCDQLAEVIAEWSGVHKGINYSNKPSDQYPTVGWCLSHDNKSRSNLAHNRREVEPDYLTPDDFFKELDT